MQLMIDVAQETSAALRLCAQFLNDAAMMKEQGTMQGVQLPPVPVVPSPDFVPPVGLDVPAGTPTHTRPDREFSDIALENNVLPFIPPVPAAASPEAFTGSAPTVPPVPSVPTAIPPAPVPGSVASAPPAATMTPSSASDATTTSAATPDEFDSAGMPWDSRIHQSGKGKKKDLTWKLKKNIDQAIVTAVTQELYAAGRIRTAAPTTPSAPASVVPAAPFPGAVPVPPAPVDVSAQFSAGSVPPPPLPTDGAVPVPPPPVSLQAPVSVPPAPVLGVPDAAGQVVVQVGFRELVQKITKLRGDNRLSAEQVTAIVAQAGAPSLAMLANMAHLVPTVDALIDATLATA